ncbi:MAG: hypothetical protein K6T63_03825 [Alicyclobacillus herbarius]|uniref:HesB/YadR/YfhF family protein n=1 Tax=Alicyclobacillus herbarius TaxID=122960 RepID=UPI000402806E|nr:hypothetical protein [Alicyclobacillus herbarius]MCL6631739.1 hypothetical protein [Alicyclobacillus herbarius]
MKLTVTPEAARWFRSELQLQDGDAVRIFVRYGGGSVIEPGFAFGIRVEEPKSVAVMVEQEGTRYFIRRGDADFLAERDVQIAYNPAQDEIEFVIGQAS